MKSATEVHSKSVEHTLEHQLYKELGEKHGRKEKLLKNIRPMMLGSLRFPMTTPLSASKGMDNLKCNQGPGGGIDILASYKGSLTVIELKDENKPSESPEKTMEQALAYASFLHSLLRSEKAQGEKWYKFFGYEREMPKEGNLTIHVVVAMPYDAQGKGEKSFASKKIYLENGDKMWEIFEEISETPLDYLICEGTTLSRTEGQTITEPEVSRQAKVHLVSNYFNFVLCSSTNMDHIAGFYPAMPDGMSLICDKFQKDILDVARKFSGQKWMTTLHSSGHVYREDLERLFSLLQPKKGIIPIHTENQDGFRDISGGIEVLDVKDQQIIYL